MNNNGELTPKQKRFCEEILVDDNATQAAFRAGYSKRSAYSTGHANLQKPKIQRYISRLKKARNLRTQVTTDRVLEGLAKIAFAEKGKKTGDKLKALGMLAKHVCINDELLDLEKKAEESGRKKYTLEDLKRDIAEDEAKEGISDELLGLEEEAQKREMLDRKRIKLEKIERELAERGIKLDDNGEDQ